MMNTELFEKIKKEAEHGDFQAIKILTYMAINNNADAIISLKRLAEKGNPDAQREMGIYLDYYYAFLSLDHEDTTIDLSTKTNEVYFWWGKAAEQGDAFSKIRMEEYNEIILNKE